MDKNIQMHALGIYVHIPFCQSKCAYCDFYSIAGTLTKKEEQLYFNYIKSDLEKKKKYIPRNTRPVSLYFGGGTPSFVSPELIHEIYDLIKTTWTGLPFALKEVTLEANPESLNEKKIDGWIKAGINRIHLGVQSTNPSLMRYLGRNSAISHAEKALQLLRNSPLHNYGADMIYGIYGQKMQDLQQIMNLFNKYNVKHISAYTLTLHEGTRLHKEIHSGSKKSASPKKDYCHDSFIENNLSSAGFYRYEISNYAKPRYESLHNTLYWKYRPYLGLGPSAHSFLPPWRIENRDSHSGGDSHLGGDSHSGGDSHFDGDSHSGGDSHFEREDSTNMHIGLYRYRNYQSFSVFRHLNEEEKQKTMMRLKDLEKKGIILLSTHGFRVSPKGMRFNDDLLEYMMR